MEQGKKNKKTKNKLDKYSPIYFKKWHNRDIAGWICKLSRPAGYRG